MELRHLRYFLAVAEEQSFGRAAARLFISQPTLSQQIQSLEAEVGGALLLRTSRRVELTETGRLLLPEARRAVDQTDRALGVARASAAGELGSLRIGFTGVAALSGLLSADLRQFRAKHPAVVVELLEAPPETLARHVREKVVDVAYTPEIGEDPGVRAWRRQPVHPYLAVPAGHPLATAPRVHVDALERETLIAFASEHDQWSQQLLVTVPHDQLLAATSTLGVLAMVSAGAGVAVVPRVLEAVAMPGVTFVPLDGAAEKAVVIAVGADEPTGPVRALLRVSDATPHPSR